MKKLNKNTLFKTVPPAAKTLLDNTTQVARAIVASETDARQVKTARLREARLAKLPAGLLKLA